MPREHKRDLRWEKKFSRKCSKKERKDKGYFFDNLSFIKKIKTEVQLGAAFNLEQFLILQPEVPSYI